MSSKELVSSFSPPSSRPSFGVPCFRIDIVREVKEYRRYLFVCVVDRPKIETHIVRYSGFWGNIFLSHLLVIFNSEDGEWIIFVSSCMRILLVSTFFARSFVVGLKSMSTTAMIRSATVADLPQIRPMIMDSFLAMLEFMGEEARTKITESAENSMKSDLTEESFVKTYLSSPDTHFWVAESPEKKIVGTAAIKRNNVEEAELVRMAVDSTIRGQGLGGQLFDTMETFCRRRRVHRISIITGNPKSADFYRKNGALTRKTASFKASTDVEVNVNYLVKYLGEKIVRRVAIVGGTHGNECLGVELIKQWTTNSSPIQRSTFESIPVLGNPAAVLANRRFVDEDLNRQFTGLMQDYPTSAQPLPLEKKRAYELNAVLGPKAASAFDIPGVDFIIDVHSSTSNTGLVAFVSGIDHDCYARRLCHHLQNILSPDVELRVVSSAGGKADSYSLDSIARSSVGFEVGPLAHGLLDHKLLEETRRLVQITLDFIESTNVAILKEAESALANGEVSTQNYRDDLRYAGEDETFDSNTVRLVPTSVAPKSIIPTKFPPSPYFVRVGEVSYPLSGEVGSGSMIEGMPASLIDDATREALANRKSFILHPQWMMGDWRTIQDGDNLFVAADGSGTTLRFQRKDYLFPSEASKKENESVELFTLFIAEAAYAPRNIAMTLYKKVDDFVY